MLLEGFPDLIIKGGERREKETYLHKGLPGLRQQPREGARAPGPGHPLTSLYLLTPSGSGTKPMLAWALIFRRHTWGSILVGEGLQPNSLHPCPCGWSLQACHNGQQKGTTDAPLPPLQSCYSPLSGHPISLHPPPFPCFARMSAGTVDTQHWEI